MRCPEAVRCDASHFPGDGGAWLAAALTGRAVERGAAARGVAAAVDAAGLRLRRAFGFGAAAAATSSLVIRLPERTKLRSKPPAFIFIPRPPVEIKSTLKPAPICVRQRA